MINDEINRGYSLHMNTFLPRIRSVPPEKQELGGKPLFLLIKRVGNPVFKVKLSSLRVILSEIGRFCVPIPVIVKAKLLFSPNRDSPLIA